MTFDDRVNAVAELGFTDRQARFLVAVMLHAGVCVPRQYARFAGTAYGHNVTDFFDKVVRGGYASACACLPDTDAPIFDCVEAVARVKTSRPEGGARSLTVSAAQS